MIGGDLLEQLRVLETELHRFETRQNRKRIELLLHPDFVEFSRSGRRYNRREALEEFTGGAIALEPVHAGDFEIVELGCGRALLTYWSVHKNSSGEFYRRTLRSSLWVETEAGWQMLFHQGTAAEVVPAA